MLQYTITQAGTCIRQVTIVGLCQPDAVYIQVAKLNQSWRSVAQVGDVLRACTCTNLVYATRSLLGVKAPVRTIVVYGADNQKWPKVSP